MKESDDAWDEVAPSTFSEKRVICRQDVRASQSTKYLPFRIRNTDEVDGAGDIPKPETYGDFGAPDTRSVGVADLPVAFLGGRSHLGGVEGLHTPPPTRGPLPHRLGEPRNQGFVFTRAWRTGGEMIRAQSSSDIVAG